MKHHGVYAINFSAGRRSIAEQLIKISKGARYLPYRFNNA